MAKRTAYPSWIILESPAFLHAWQASVAGDSSNERYLIEEAPDVEVGFAQAQGVWRLQELSQLSGEREPEQYRGLNN